MDNKHEIAYKIANDFKIVEYCISKARKLKENNQVEVIDYAIEEYLKRYEKILKTLDKG